MIQREAKFLVEYVYAVLGAGISWYYRKYSHSKHAVQRIHVNSLGLAFHFLGSLWVNYFNLDLYRRKTYLSGVSCCKEFIDFHSQIFTVRYSTILREVHI